MAKRPWYNVGMREMAISKFKVTCLAVIEEVRRTGAPVRITRFGRAVAEIVPSRSTKSSSWLGCAKNSIEIHGDISEPISAFDRWTAEPK
jgi:antitoxin (DNA-binding transcriptional repressor) of toxin-antitoxin stability system